jgi:hypothetical protein
MYFDHETLESELKCSFCYERFNDPRVLPCGNTCCLNCIINERNMTNSFECKLCKDTHETNDPTKYPISHLVNNLLKKTEHKISSQFIKMGFKEEFDKFKNKTKDLIDKNFNFDKHLSEYCETMRHQITVRTESIINCLNEHCDKMCKQIDNYENEKKKEWKMENQKNQNNLSMILDKNLIIQDNMMQLYKNPNAKEDQVNQALETMKVNSIQLENEYIKISKRIFNIQYLQSDQKIGADFIGELFNVKKCEKLDLTRQQSDSTIFDVSFIGQSKSISILSKNLDSNSIAIYDLKPVITYKTGLVTKSNSYYLYNLFCDFILLTNLSLLYIFKYNSVSNDYKVHLSESVLHSKFITVCADIDSIFLMDSDFEVNCYDWKLNKVQTIGQVQNGKQPFYFKDVIQMETRNKKFYLRRPNRIDIVDHKDGKELKRIKINSYKFIINDDEKQLIVFCDDSISRYDLESANFISKINTKPFFPSGFKLIDYKDDDYLLLSKNKKDLYSIKI